MCRLTTALSPVLFLAFLPAPLAAESWGPGKYSKVGKLTAVSGREVILTNGRRSQERFQLNKADEGAQLKRHLGAYVKLNYTQTNRAGWGIQAQIQQLGVTVLYDAARPFPLKVRGKIVASQMTFGQALSVRVRLANRSDRTITLGGDQVFAYLTSKHTDAHEIILRSPKDRPANPGMALPSRVLGPGASVEVAMTCTNLILPGKYAFRAQAPPLDGLDVESDAVALEVVSPSREFTRKTLLASFDHGSPTEQIGIAWILWRDFDDRAGMTKLTAVMDAQAHPWRHTAGIVALAEGEKGIEPFLRAIRKEGSGTEIHYWCEQAAQSSVREKLFLVLLAEGKKVEYSKVRGEAVPIAHLVAQFLLYYTEGPKTFPWGDTFEERQRVVDGLRQTLRNNPRRIRLFAEPAFSPTTIDGWVRQCFHWGSF